MQCINATEIDNKVDFENIDGSLNCEKLRQNLSKKLECDKYLHKLHIKFGHRVEQLLKKIKQAGIGIEKIKPRLIEIAKNCETCHKYASKPRQPKTTTEIAENVNDIVYMDGVEIDSWITNGSKTRIKAQHIVDAHSGYSFGIISSYSEDNAIHAFHKYAEETGSWPKILRCDNHASYEGEKFSSMMDRYDVHIEFGGIYTPEQQGVVERANGVLKELYLKTKDNLKNELGYFPSPEVILSAAVHAKNSTPG